MPISILQRILVPQPGKVEPYPDWKVPVVEVHTGVRVQINAYHDDMGNVLERWLLSETDERWYRIEKYTTKWVGVKVTVRGPVST